LAAGARLEAPAGLAGRLGAAMSGTEAAGAGAAVLKGGFAMKLAAGIVLAGAVAVGAAVSTGMLGGGGKPLAAEKPRKFSTPVWHPEARWECAKEHFAGLGLGGCFSMGELDGPRREVINRTIGRPSLFSGLSVSGRYVFMSYDKKTERFHGVTAGAAGYLDGPFSRARFYGTDYLPRQSFLEVQSPDGRYVYLVSESWGDARVRCLDFVEQTVRTLPSGKAPPVVVGVDDKGKVYVINYEQELVVLDPAQDWKPVHTVALETKEKIGGLGRSIAPDEVHGRVYATTYRSKNYYVWYWNVEDGSFHGLVPHPPKGGPSRPGGMGGCTPGPFKGANFYNEGSVGFGPDDPEKRFLYVGRIDDPSLYRLDLMKEEVWKFDSKAGRFIGTGERRHPAVTYGVMPTWFEDGSFMGTYMRLWRRVK
jgi:hypothetical protein